MAFAVVRKGQTGSTAASSLATEGATATAGNLLLVIAGQINSLAAISVTDDKGSSGWTNGIAKCEYGVSVNSGWLSWKIAAGGEKEIKATAGAGGTVEGVTYIEVSGVTVPELDTSGVHNNGSSAKEIALEAANGLITVGSEDIVFAAVCAAAASTGTISAWTGSPTAPTNVATASSRIIGGYFVAESTLAKATMTAKWETAKATGMLAVAFKSGTSGAAGAQVMVV